MRLEVLKIRQLFPKTAKCFAKEIFARGKLLLSGEYVVLDNAMALAIPTVYGQHLTVEESKKNVSWISLDNNGEEWFNAHFDLDLNIISSSDISKANTLRKVLSYGYSQSKKEIKPCKLTTQLDFPNNWGLGSSSTLIYLIASWLEIEPMDLFFTTSSGSGYDIACAGERHPIIYTLNSGKPEWNSVKLPEALYQTYFIHLNQKQQSSKEVALYQNKSKPTKNEIEEINHLTNTLLSSSSISDIQNFIDQHEEIMSNILNRKTIKENLFPDFEGSIKSLGAWGGDFVLAIGNNTVNYFKAKGYPTIISFKNMIA